MVMPLVTTLISNENRLIFHPQAGVHQDFIELGGHDFGEVFLRHLTRLKVGAKDIIEFFLADFYLESIAEVTIEFFL